MAVKVGLKLAHRLFNQEPITEVDAQGDLVEYKAIGDKTYFLQVRSHAPHIEDKSKITLSSSLNYKGTSIDQIFF